MSTCAVMLVKDEADIVEYTIRHLAGQVDAIIVADNMSSDGTAEILEQLRMEVPFHLRVDEDPGYWQSKKTTALAMLALEFGHRWVLPCDADEFWYAPDGRRVADFLAGLAPDVQVVKADLFNHLPSVEDPPTWCAECGCLGYRVDVSPMQRAASVCPVCKGHCEPNPFKRIGWRQREHGALGKVAARLRPDLVIHAGNHGASTGGTGLTSAGLVVRHFSWRSPEQYLRKIRNGQTAYSLTTLDPSVGAHWRMFEHATDEAITAHFREWFWTADPRSDGTLIYDPAPGA